MRWNFHDDPWMHLRPSYHLGVMRFQQSFPAAHHPLECGSATPGEWAITARSAFISNATVAAFKRSTSINLVWRGISDGCIPEARSMASVADQQAQASRDTWRLCGHAADAPED